MNDAQLFTVFLSILGFGWLGFLAAKAWSSPIEKFWHFPAILFFFLGSAFVFIEMAVNLISLVGRNF